MRWLPLAVVLLVTAVLVFFGWDDIATHGLFSKYTIAPIVMAIFVFVAVRFFTRNGATPGGRWS